MLSTKSTRHWQNWVNFGKNILIYGCQLACPSLELVGEIARAVAAMQAAGYEPYDQLYGYVTQGNDQFITLSSGAREIVTKMDVRDIKMFLKHYKELTSLR